MIIFFNIFFSYFRSYYFFDNVFLTLIFTPLNSQLFQLSLIVLFLLSFHYYKTLNNHKNLEKEKYEICLQFCIKLLDTEFND